MLGHRGGEEGEYVDEVMADGASAASEWGAHPCAKLWAQFSSCMESNTQDIGRCQSFYDVFNQCQLNPQNFE